MDKQEIYWQIEEKAGVRGNGWYIPGDDPVYTFEPGRTPLPASLSIIYYPDADQGIVTIKGGSVFSPAQGSLAFCGELVEELGSIKAGSLSYVREEEKYVLEFDQFQASHVPFAEALRNVLNRYRFFLPSLSQAKFENVDNDEYSLSTKCGQLWIPGYVCHGAFYDILLAAVDLTSLDSYEEVRDYATDMIRIQQELAKNYFLARFKTQTDYRDLEIKAEAVSTDKIRADLEKIVKIVSGQIMSR